MKMFGDFATALMVAALAANLLVLIQSWLVYATGRNPRQLTFAGAGIFLLTIQVFILGFVWELRHG